jgi:hypothetical protein
VSVIIIISSSEIVISSSEIVISSSEIVISSNEITQSTKTRQGGDPAHLLRSPPLLLF